MILGFALLIIEIDVAYNVDFIRHTCTGYAKVPAIKLEIQLQSKYPIGCGRACPRYRPLYIR
jgi:hypothetical protein